MKSGLKVLTVLCLIVGFMVFALPARAETGNWLCVVSPGSGPVGTVFTIVCTGFSPNTTLNVYAVEPDGRASGLNTYGFFPTVIKTDATGTAGFHFVTDFPGFYSVPPGDYIFVVRELGLQNTSLAEAHLPVSVESKAEPHLGAWLSVVGVGDTGVFTGGGFAPGEEANVWVTPPGGAVCSGLGLDQLTLGALGAGGTILWSGPNTVKADSGGNIAFTITFNPSACEGDYAVTVRSPSSGLAAETHFTFVGHPVTESGGAYITVTPNSVPVYHSHFVVSGWGFPADSTINCWFTRPDGRVLSFINVNPKTDASGSFSTGASMDDFPPYTSSDPGTWYATCATPDRSFLATTSFTGYALTSDP